MQAELEQERQMIRELYANQSYIDSQSRLIRDFLAGKHSIDSTSAAYLQTVQAEAQQVVEYANTGLFCLVSGL